MEREKVDSMNNKNNSQDNLILAINILIKETNLSEFDELKESIDNINLEVNKIIKNSCETKTDMIQKDNFDYLS
ncbi:MAG: hypothetical protein ACLUFU_07095 [Bacilli bacterium]